MNVFKSKIIVSIILVFALLLTGCNNSAKYKSAKKMIEKDLSVDISVNKCLYNEEKDAMYLQFTIKDFLNDEAIILFDNDKIYYESVYSTISSNDYNSIIAYGDYTVLKYSAISNKNNEKWKVVETD